MAEMSQNTHRLSIEWSRIQPNPHSWSDDALARYREIIQKLREYNIEPMVTLHHFTLPLWAAEQGGWENEQSVQWFNTYVEKVIDALGDKVKLWCTINEPMVLVGMGYLLGRWPPKKRSLNDAYRVVINLARAHAAAYHTIHATYPDAQVGLAKHMVNWRPHRFWLPTDHLFSQLVNRVTNHAILDAVSRGTVKFPLRRSLRIKETAKTLDWVGVNYYQRYRVGIRLWDSFRNLFPGFDAKILHTGTKPGMQKGPGEWGEIHPRGMLTSVRSVTRYGKPVYITENGIPDEHDEYRPAFILGHLFQLWKATQQNLDVRGYYHWSLVDNFEWTEGYDPRFRFGLIGVNFKNQQRSIRQSGKLFSEICNQNGFSAEMVAKYAPDLLDEIFQEFDQNN